jgi:(2Fe-2S) ferredoxin
MNFYTRHIFFCNNIRKDGKACCSQFNAKTMYRYAKDKCRQEGIMGEGKIGISESCCLGRCEYGPVAVVYPDKVWYQYIDEEDINDIITEHLTNGNVVKRLQIN